MHGLLEDYLCNADDPECRYALDQAIAESELARFCIEYFAKIVDRPIFFPIGESPTYKLSTYHLGRLSFAMNRYGPTPIDRSSPSTDCTEGHYFWLFVKEELVPLSYSTLYLFTHFATTATRKENLEGLLRTIAYAFYRNSILRIWATFGTHLHPSPEERL